MKTYLERAIEFEDKMLLECQRRYPALDARWAVNRMMAENGTAYRRNLEVAALMGPAVFRMRD